MDHIFSYSQLGTFRHCRKMWWDKSVTKKYKPEPTEPLLVGQLTEMRLFNPDKVDEWLAEHEQEIYCYGKPERGLKVAFGRDVDAMVVAVWHQPALMQLIEHPQAIKQLEVRGMIGNVLVRGFVDLACVEAGWILDFKTAAVIAGDGASKWSIDKQRREMWWEPYTAQAAIYQHLCSMEDYRPEVKDLWRDWEKRCHFVVEEINRIPKLSCLPPEGGFYAWINIKDNDS